MSARQAKRPVARRVRVGSRQVLHHPTLIRPFGPPSPNGRRKFGDRLVRWVEARPATAYQALWIRTVFIILCLPRNKAKNQGNGAEGQTGQDQCSPVYLSRPMSGQFRCEQSQRAYAPTPQGHRRNDRNSPPARRADVMQSLHCDSREQEFAHPEARNCHRVGERPELGDIDCGEGVRCSRADQVRQPRHPAFKPEIERRCGVGGLDHAAEASLSTAPYPGATSMPSVTPFSASRRCARGKLQQGRCMKMWCSAWKLTQ